MNTPSIQSENASLDGIPIPGDLIVGKYEVENLIGLGGMGAVLAGTHLHLQQPVAIKVLLPTYVKNQSIRSRFLREARAAARLRSDHITRTYDVGTLENGLPFMVMERLEGVDLAEALKNDGPFPIEQAVSFVLQACEALAEAHAAGIVHRDLKPGNLFLANKPNGSTIVKVLDFGISKTLDELGSDAPNFTALTSPHSLLGSPHYMSPEQVKDSREVDTRSDIWAMGVLLYELLTLNMPFDATSLPHLYARILSEEPVLPSTHRPDIPLGLQGVILRCLRKPVEERIQDVCELAERLIPYGPSWASTSVEQIRHAFERRSSSNSLRPNQAPAGMTPVSDFENSPTSLAPAEPKQNKRLSRGIKWGGIAAMIAVLTGGSFLVSRSLLEPTADDIPATLMLSGLSSSHQTILHQVEKRAVRVVLISPGPNGVGVVEAKTSTSFLLAKEGTDPESKKPSAPSSRNRPVSGSPSTIQDLKSITLID